MNLSSIDEIILSISCGIAIGLIIVLTWQNYNTCCYYCCYCCNKRNRRRRNDPSDDHHNNRNNNGNNKWNLFFNYTTSGSFPCVLPCPQQSQQQGHRSSRNIDNVASYTSSTNIYDHENDDMVPYDDDNDSPPPHQRHYIMTSIVDSGIVSSASSSSSTNATLIRSNIDINDMSSTVDQQDNTTSVSDSSPDFHLVPKWHGPINEVSGTPTSLVALSSSSSTSSSTSSYTTMREENGGNTTTATTTTTINNSTTSNEQQRNSSNITILDGTDTTRDSDHMNDKDAFENSTSDNDVSNGGNTLLSISTASINTTMLMNNNYDDNINIDDTDDDDDDDEFSILAFPPLQPHQNPQRLHGNEGESPQQQQQFMSESFLSTAATTTTSSVTNDGVDATSFVETGTDSVSINNVNNLTTTATTATTTTKILEQSMESSIMM